MTAWFLDALFAGGIGLSGMAAGFFLARRSSPQPAPGVDTERMREVMARVRDLAATVAANVGEHSRNVQEINDELSNVEGQDADCVLTAVSKLIQNNEQMQQQLHTAESRLQEQAEQIEVITVAAHTDALTRLNNRRAFDEMIQRQIKAFQDKELPACVMMFDVDHFKKFNDTYGHQAGDEVLRGVARVLREAAREGDFPARYGGEEFSIVLPASGIEQARPVAERARRLIETTTFHHEGVDLKVTASVGVARIVPGETTEEWIHRADEALYAAKQNGRNLAYWHNGQECVPVVPRIEPVDEPPADPVFSKMSNRASFHDDVVRRVAEWKRGGSRVSLAMVEIDDMTRMLAVHGAAALDVAMRATGQLLLSAMRDMDHIARYDKETYALLMPSAGLEDAANVAERIRSAASRFVLPMTNGKLRFTVSVGVAEASISDTADKLLQRAEQALDAATTDGADRVFLHDGRESKPVAEPAKAQLVQSDL